MSRVTQAMTFFQNVGWTNVQARGIVGNLIAESRLNPTIGGDKNKKGQPTSFGIAQWRGGRLARLKRFAKKQGTGWQDFETQLAFVHHELQTTEKSAGRNLAAATTVEDATKAFIGFERPLGWTKEKPEKGHNYAGRLNYARTLSGSSERPYTPSSLPIAPPEPAGSEGIPIVEDSDDYELVDFSPIPEPADFGEFADLGFEDEVGYGGGAGGFGGYPDAVGMDLIPSPPPPPPMEVGFVQPNLEVPTTFRERLFGLGKDPEDV